MAGFPDGTDIGLYIPTTTIWGLDDIEEMDVKSPEFKRLLVQLYENINNIAYVLNLKDSAYYVQQEFVNGQQYFPGTISSTTDTNLFRNVYRKVVDCSALANTGTTTTAHGISMTNTFTFTRIYGAASDQVGKNFLPLPYASPTLANNIEINVDATNINITTGSDRTAFTLTYVVLEYLKSN